MKNLEPNVEIVGMALTVVQMAAKTRRIKAGREAILLELSGLEAMLPLGS